MSNTDKTAFVPKLRFPEFQKAAAWTEKSGNSLFDQISDRNPEPGLPVLAITQEHGAIPRHMIDYHVSVTDKSIESYKVVQVGDFIISLRSFQGGIEYSQYRGICSPAYVVLRRRGEGSDVYFRHYFKTERFIQILTTNLEGLRDGKMISYKQFSELRLPVPSPSEQQKIADCLSSLDELIAAQARKVDALKTHKKGLMQQLFTSEGETQPRLRFPELRDAGDWVMKTLDAIAPLQRGFDLPSDDIRPGSVPIFYSNGPKGFHERGMANGPGLVTGRSGTLGKLHFIESGHYWPHNTSLWVTSFKGHSPKFVYYLYEFIGFLRFASGSGVPTLNRNDAHSFQASVPNEFVEQERIAACLGSLDTLITAATQELEALKTHKRGLMQQLFPSAEAVEA